MRVDRTDGTKSYSALPLGFALVSWVGCGDDQFCQLFQGFPGPPPGSPGLLGKRRTIYSQGANKNCCELPWTLGDVICAILKYTWVSKDPRTTRRERCGMLFKAAT